MSDLTALEPHVGTLEAGSRHDLRVGLSPDAPDEAQFQDQSKGAYGYVAFLRDVLALRRTRACGRSCSSRAACFAAPTATIRIPGT